MKIFLITYIVKQIQSWILFYQHKKRHLWVDYDSPIEDILFNTLFFGVPMLISYELEERCYKKFGNCFVPEEVIKYREYLDKLRPGTTFNLDHLTLEIVGKGFSKGYYSCKDVATGNVGELHREVILKNVSNQTKI